MNPYYKTNLGTLYHGDCREILPHLPISDLILTDPPYGIFVGGSKGIVGGSKIVDPTQYEIAEWDKTPIDLAYFDILKARSKHQIIFGYNYISDILPPTRGFIVWDKKVKNNWFDNFSDCELAWTSFDVPARCFRHLWMGALRQTEQGAGKRFHPTQKPVALMVWIVTNYAEAHHVICDPFMGSGSTAIACERLGMRWVGIEMSEKYCQVIVERLNSNEWTANKALQRSEGGERKFRSTTAPRAPLAR